MCVRVRSAQRVVCMDLHAGQIQGFFDMPVDHLYAAPILIDYIKDRVAECKKEGKELVIVAPDAGGVERARYVAERLHVGLAPGKTIN